jgi:hypothetical protein
VARYYLRPDRLAIVLVERLGVPCRNYAAQVLKIEVIDMVDLDLLAAASASPVCRSRVPPPATSRRTRCVAQFRWCSHWHQPTSAHRPARAITQEKGVRRLLDRHRGQGGVERLRAVKLVVTTRAEPRAECADRCSGRSP